MTQGYSIYSSRCYIKEQLIPATLQIYQGKITGIHSGRSEHAIDYKDCVIMPGVIDVHVHINEPGRTDWEGFDSATRAAAAGGVTTVIDMPLNSSPVTTSVKNLHKKIEASLNKTHVNVGFYGGLVPANVLSVKALAENGVFGIKCFLTHSGIDDFPNVTRQDLEIVMPDLARLGIPLLVHCELTGNEHTVINENSYTEYLLSRPDKYEVEAVELIIDLCRKYLCRVHIVHVSSSLSLSLIKNAKNEGLPISAETCPHYLYFNQESIPDGACVYKCAPPIRSRKNNEQLISGLREGILDFISSDHSPATPDLKELETGNLSKAWGGIAGLQFLLSASWTSVKDSISLQQFIPLLSSKPAEFLGLKQSKGFLKEGYDADIVIWNPESTFKVHEKDIFHRHKCSPYIGHILQGVIKETIVNGETVFKDYKHINLNAGECILKK